MFPIWGESGSFQETAPCSSYDFFRGSRTWRSGLTSCLKHLLRCWGYIHDFNRSHWTLLVSLLTAATQPFGSCTNRVLLLFVTRRTVLTTKTPTPTNRQPSLSLLVNSFVDFGESGEGRNHEGPCGLYILYSLWFLECGRVFQ